ncbi:hypothetical protein PSEEN1864 [Pseudomonas entomophila L48]|uniref:Uncharacterized protein n=1 Tax=Pseudomonas entomophila (strain L48) TaxID=384676 RepID=Q1ICB2_PSEE4|nr:hypothetical protein PSEEN1864 [Pseudomonas entomophila L48]
MPPNAAFFVSAPLSDGAEFWRERHFAGVVRPVSGLLLCGECRYRKGCKAASMSWSVSC